MEPGGEVRGGGGGVWIEEQTGLALAQQRLQAADVAGDHGPARTPRLQHDDAERLVHRRQDEHIAGMEGLDEFGVVVAQAGQQADAGAKLVRADELAEVRGVGGLGFGADEDEERLGRRRRETRRW